MKSRLLLGVFVFLAQWGIAQQNPHTNLRKKLLPVGSDTLYLDTLSIIPGTVVVDGINANTYYLDYFAASLVWITRPHTDTVSLVYRVFDTRIERVLQRINYDSISVRHLAAPFVFAPGLEQTDIFDFGNIEYNGSFGRGLSFGNQQDVVLNSTLNLQLSGFMADSIEIAAAITDSNIPIQPDGNTQNLNEFDRIFIQFKKNNWQFSIGDIDIRQQKNHFLQYYSRLQGASFEQKSHIGKNVTNQLMLSGAIAKGKYTRNVFEGLEGNQGPYRLTGPNNELFFIVLAGTERVFIDGQLMQRGEDQDYVINYNTAEVRFTPKRMITKDSRIQIEFGYADRNYLNTQLYVADEVSIGKKLNLSVAAYQNADAKNSPINQTLDVNQKQFLADIGDSLHRALYPSQVLDTFSVNKILYKKIDTTYNGINDSIYIYSPQPADQLYNLAFTEVGTGNGNYILDETSSANGKLFKWVSPDENNNPTGRYDAVILLVAPRKHQVITVGADYAFTNQTTVSTALAMSIYDNNTLSRRDKGDDRGYAAKFAINDLRPLKREGTTLKSTIGYEFVQQQFRPVERLRSVEFYRIWGLPVTNSTTTQILATENLFNAGTELRSGNSSISYQIEHYQRSDGYNGIRNSISQRATYGTWHFNNEISYTSFSQLIEKGHFFKPTVDVSKDFPKLANHRLGASYTAEKNYIKLKERDSLNAASFLFDIWQVYLKSPEANLNKWGITYFTRQDSRPSQARLSATDRSSNVNAFLDLMKSDRHQLKLNATYRSLNILDDKLTKLQAEETILGRIEYFSRIWKGIVSGNALYEAGTGQEQKRDFTYVEVPPGMGEYTWNDYNGNGIPELNEFEISQFQDQAKYIRIFTPTNEFIKANYLQFNYSLIINPRAVQLSNTSAAFNRFLHRWYVQSSLQINKKEMSDHLQFNPFAVPLSDTSLIVMNRVLSNTVSFNRLSSSWGIDVNNLRTGNRSFLTYGYETRTFTDWNVKGRLNLFRLFLLEMMAKTNNNTLTTPNFDNRNYDIESYILEPRLSFIRGTKFRAMAGYQYNDKQNLEAAQRAYINAFNSEVKYNMLSTGSITTKFTYSHINYSDPENNHVSNSTVSYIMLDALMPGKNYLWSIDFTRRLSRFLEMSFQYEGRKPGNTQMIHIGRASLRAMF